MGREGRAVAVACIVAVVGLSLIYGFAASWREVVARAFDHALWVALITFLVVNGNAIRGLLTGMQLDRATLKQIEVNLENLRLQQDQIRQHIRLMELQQAELERKLSLVQVVSPEVDSTMRRTTGYARFIRVEEPKGEETKEPG